VRVRAILLISIVVNVALAAAFLGWFTRHPKDPTQFVRPVNVAAVNSNSIRIIKTNVLVRPRLFTWEEVESADYPTYIQNLRGIGMPENTIRDIIIADVDQLFTRKRRELMASQDIEWWRAQPSASYESNVVARTSALELERANLLTRLLGEHWKDGRLDQQPDPVPLTGPVLSALTDDAKKSVQDIAAKSAERMRDYLAQAQAAGQQPNALEMAKIREQTREQLAQVLNPQQLEEFLIRNSYNATELRRQLNGLEVNPDEFRSIFRAVDQIDRDIQLKYAGADAESQRQRAVLEQQRLNVIRDTLGAERYDNFVMYHDPAYQDALATAQKAGASQDAAAALYEIQRATTDELDRIRNDPSLTAAQKQEQIREAQLEQERARALVLGEQPPAESTQNTPQLRTHTKLPGETLGEIALRYGVGVSAIRQANPGLDINRLPGGVPINIPVAPPAPPPLPYPPGAR